MATAEIEWAEPPAEAFQPTRNAVIVAALKQRPGVWARLKKSASSGSAAAQYKKLGLQVVIHRTNPGATPARYDVYGRWPATPQKPAPAGAYKPEERAARGIPADGKPLPTLGKYGNGARV